MGSGQLRIYSYTHYHFWGRMFGILVYNFLCLNGRLLLLKPDIFRVDKVILGRYLLRFT